MIRAKNMYNYALGTLAYFLKYHRLKVAQNYYENIPLDVLLVLKMHLAIRDAKLVVVQS